MPHLKRLNMPEMWPLPRKEKVFVVTPLPGPHPKMGCIPLLVVLRDTLKIAGSADEAKKIIKSGRILVDKKPRKEPRFPVGLMDIFEIPETGEHYRVEAGRSGLFLNRITPEQAAHKICRIMNKTAVRGGLAQLNLHDGRNILVEKGSEKEFSLGDSVVIRLPEQKIVKNIKLQKKSHAIIFSGRNKGESGVIKEVRERGTMLGKSAVIIRTKDGREIETLKDYVMVGEA